MKFRITSFFTALAMLVSSIPAYPVAVMPDIPASAVREIRPGQVSLPSSLGKIEETYTATSQSPVVILIQNAHAVQDAQTNIQKLISHFQTHYGVDLVAVEGAASALDPWIFRSFPDKELLKKVFEEYRAKDELTGVAAAAVFNEGKSLYHGIENWELYQQGLRFYLAALKKEPVLLERLASQERELQLRKETVYSKKLLKIDQTVREFRRNHKDLVEVSKLFASVRKPKKGSPLALLLEEFEREGEKKGSYEIEVVKIAEQIERHLKSQMPSKENRKHLKAFHEKFQEFRTSRLSAEAFGLFLQETMSSFPSELVLFSEALDHRVTRQKKMRDIEGTKLFRDFERYAGEVKERLFRSEEERMLDQESRRLELLERLARLELSREDWEELKISRQSAVSSEQIEDSKFAAHYAFYENAENRDEAFFKNFTKLLRHSAPPTSQPNPRWALLVAGGFHTEGLIRRLKAAGTSYLLLTPAIGSIPETTRYRDLMRGEVSWKNYFKVENGKINFYSAFVRAARDRLLKLEVGSLKLEKMGFLQPPTSNLQLARRWRDQIIRDLAVEKRLDEAGRYTRFLDELREGEDDPVLAEQFKKIDTFVGRLRALDARGELTGANVLKLLRPAAVEPLVANTLLAPGDAGDGFAFDLPPSSLFSRSEARVFDAVARLFPDDQKAALTQRLLDELKTAREYATGEPASLLNAFRARIESGEIDFSLAGEEGSAAFTLLTEFEGIVFFNNPEIDGFIPRDPQNLLRQFMDAVNARSETRVDLNGVEWKTDIAIKRQDDDVIVDIGHYQYKLKLSDFEFSSEGIHQNFLINVVRGFKGDYELLSPNEYPQYRNFILSAAVMVNNERIRITGQELVPTSAFEIPLRIVSSGEQLIMKFGPHIIHFKPSNQNYAWYKVGLNDFETDEQIDWYPTDSLRREVQYIMGYQFLLPMIFEPGIDKNEREKRLASIPETSFVDALNFVKNYYSPAEGQGPQLSRGAEEPAKAQTQAAADAPEPITEDDLRAALQQGEHVLELEDFDRHKRGKGLEPLIYEIVKELKRQGNKEGLNENEVWKILKDKGVNSGRLKGRDSEVTLTIVNLVRHGVRSEARQPADDLDGLRSGPSALALSKSPEETRRRAEARSEIDKDVDQFVRGTMDEIKRRQFVEKLAAEPELREHIRMHREQHFEWEISISDGARRLADKGIADMVDAIRNSPGHSFREDSLPGPDGYGRFDRALDKLYQSAKDTFQALLKMGELEDIALENLDRIEKNAGLRRVKKWLDPIELSFKELSVDELLTLDYSQPSNVQLLINHLWKFLKLGPFYLFPSEVKPILEEPKLLEILKRNKNIAPVLNEFAKKYEKKKEDPEKHMLRAKAAAFRLLLVDYLNTPNEAKANPSTLIEIFEEVLKKNQTMPLNDKEEELFEYLLHHLLSASDSRDEIWQVFFPVLQTRLENGIYGIRRYSKTELQFEGYTNEFIASLKYLKRRLKTDSGVQALAISFFTHANPSIRRDAIAPAALLPSAQAIPFLAEEVGSTLWRGDSAADYLLTFGSTELQAVPGLADKIFEKLKKHTEQYAFSEDNPDKPKWLAYQLNLVQILHQIDPAKGEEGIRLILKTRSYHGRSGEGDILSWVIAVAVEYNYQNLKEAFLGLPLAEENVESFKRLRSLGITDDEMAASIVESCAQDCNLTRAVEALINYLDSPQGYSVVQRLLHEGINKLPTYDYSGGYFTDSPILLPAKAMVQSKYRNQVTDGDLDALVTGYVGFYELDNRVGVVVRTYEAAQKILLTLAKINSAMTSRVNNALDRKREAFRNERDGDKIHKWSIKIIDELAGEISKLQLTKVSDLDFFAGPSGWGEMLKDIRPPVEVFKLLVDAALKNNPGEDASLQEKQAITYVYVILKVWLPKGVDVQKVTYALLTHIKEFIKKNNLTKGDFVEEYRVRLPEMSAGDAEVTKFWSKFPSLGLIHHEIYHRSIVFKALARQLQNLHDALMEITQSRPILDSDVEFPIYASALMRIGRSGEVLKLLRVINVNQAAVLPRLISFGFQAADESIDSLELFQDPKEVRQQEYEKGVRVLEDLEKISSGNFKEESVAPSIRQVVNKVILGKTPANTLRDQINQKKEELSRLIASRDQTNNTNSLGAYQKSVQDDWRSQWDDKNDSRSEARQPADDSTAGGEARVVSNQIEEVRKGDFGVAKDAVQSAAVKLPVIGDNQDLTRNGVAKFNMTPTLADGKVAGSSQSFNQITSGDTWQFHKGGNVSNSNIDDVPASSGPDFLGIRRKIKADGRSNISQGLPAGPALGPAATQGGDRGDHKTIRTLPQNDLQLHSKPPAVSQTNVTGSFLVSQPSHRSEARASQDGGGAEGPPAEGKAAEASGNDAAKPGQKLTPELIEEIVRTSIANDAVKANLRIALKELAKQLNVSGGEYSSPRWSAGDRIGGLGLFRPPVLSSRDVSGAKLATLDIEVPPVFPDKNNRVIDLSPIKRVYFLAGPGSSVYVVHEVHDFGDYPLISGGPGKTERMFPPHWQSQTLSGNDLDDLRRMNNHLLDTDGWQKKAILLAGYIVGDPTERRAIVSPSVLAKLAAVISDDGAADVGEGKIGEEEAEQMVLYIQESGFDAFSGALKRAVAEGPRQNSIGIVAGAFALVDELLNLPAAGLKPQVKEPAEETVLRRGTLPLAILFSKAAGQTTFFETLVQGIQANDQKGIILSNSESYDQMVRLGFGKKSQDGVDLRKLSVRDLAAGVEVQFSGQGTNPDIAAALDREDSSGLNSMFQGLFFDGKNMTENPDTQLARQILFAGLFVASADILADPQHQGEIQSKINTALAADSESTSDPENVGKIRRQIRGEYLKGVLIQKLATALGKMGLEMDGNSAIVPGQSGVLRFVGKVLEDALANYQARAELRKSA